MAGTLLLGKGEPTRQGGTSGGTTGWSPSLMQPRGCWSRVHPHLVWKKVTVGEPGLRSLPGGWRPLPEHEFRCVAPGQEGSSQGRPVEWDWEGG